jgi:uncharacterized membrane protein YadS
LNTVGLISVELDAPLSAVARWCLVLAIAVLGVQTSLHQFASLGWRPMALMAAETVFLAVLVLVMVLAPH